LTLVALSWPWRKRIVVVMTARAAAVATEVKSSLRFPDFYSGVGFRVVVKFEEMTPRNYNSLLLSKCMDMVYFLVTFRMGEKWAYEFYPR
jgi:hypothetical protein